MYICVVGTELQQATGVPHLRPCDTLWKVLPFSPGFPLLVEVFGGGGDNSVDAEMLKVAASDCRPSEFSNSPCGTADSRISGTE